MRRARELEGAPTPGPVDCPALPGPAALTACQAPLGSWLMLIDNSATPSLCAFAQPNDVYKCILLSAQIQLHSQFHFNMPPTTTTITCQLNFKGTRRQEIVRTSSQLSNAAAEAYYISYMISCICKHLPPEFQGHQAATDRNAHFDTDVMWALRLFIH